MTVYADVLFAINFSMDFISLFICSLIMKKRILKVRILLASLLGGLYGVFSVLVTLKPVISAIIAVLISLVMCIITYYEHSVKRFIIMYIMYWAVSSTLGGLMSVFYSFLNKVLYSQIKDYSYTKVYSGARLFIVISLTTICAMLFGRIFSEKKDIKEVLLEIKISESVFKLKGLCDSGNLLTEPISGRCVILVPESSKIGIEVMNCSLRKARYIPYSGVGREGLIKGMSPDFVKVDGSSTNALVAITNKNDFAGYDALVPSSIL